MAFETPDIVKFFERPSLLPSEEAQLKTTASSPPVGWAGVTHGKLQINDLLFDVPPEQVQIAQHYQSLEMPLLRAKENTTLKSGHGDYFLSIPLLFVENGDQSAWDAINSKLIPLAQQFRKTPFCLVENELIRKTLFPGTYDDQAGHRKELAKNMAFSLVNMTVSTVEGLPGALEARLNLIYFNYFPFSEKFTFQRYWNPRNLTFKQLSSQEEADQVVNTYNKQAAEVYNPQESEAWKAFYQYGWNYTDRRLTTDLSNNFSLEFTLINTRSPQPSFYKEVWKAVELIPVSISVDFENRIAKLPILNWVYATHQYVGGMNRRLTAVFHLESEKRQELEYLQHLVKSEQEQVAAYRYLSKHLGIKITNDVARVCGISHVEVEDLNIETIPGNPSLLQVTMVLLEHHLKFEGMTPLTQIPSMDGILQQTLERLVRLSQDASIIKPTSVPQYQLIPGQVDERNKLYNPGHESYEQSGEAIVWLSGLPDTGLNLSGSLADAMLREGGRYNEALVKVINERPNHQEALPILPGNQSGSDQEQRYYDRLRSVLKAALDGPLKNDARFADLRQAAFNLTGNYIGNISYPDLELPPHPATGRIMDTEPDCYFYNKSDTRPVDLQRAFVKGLGIINQAYSSAKEVTSGSGGLGFDYQVTSGMPLPFSSKPLRPSQVGKATSYDDIIAQANMYKKDVDPDLLKAMIGKESSWNPDAISGKGAQGLMQIMPGTAAELATQLSSDFGEEVTPHMVQKDPYWNIMGGTLYIDQMYNQFGSWELALAAYNAGPQRVIDAGYQVPNISETQNYVATIMSNWGGPSAPTATPNNSVSWVVPVSGTVTSDFYDTRDNGSRLHAGIDIAAPAGTPFVAPADMVIVANQYATGAGWLVWGQDAQGNIHEFCHLQQASDWQIGQQVSQGQVLGLVGSTGTSSSGPHLDYKVKAAASNPDAIYNNKNGYFLDIGKILGLSKNSTAVGGTAQTVSLRSSTSTPFSLGNPSGDYHSFEGWQHPPDDPGYNTNVSSINLGEDKLGWAGGKDIDYIGPQLAQLRNQTLRPAGFYRQDLGPRGAQEIFSTFANSHVEDVLTMRRAYPTFSLMFTEEFNQGFTVFLNNVYGWGAVKEIKLIRSRKNPVDTLVIQLSNAKGDLLTQQFNSLEGRSPEQDMSFNRQIIKEGTDVKLKLGYHNNPNALPTVFTGKITEIEGYNSAIITIICQSYAIELFQAEYGDNPVASMGWFGSDTKEIISTLLVLPECKHLGRYQSRQIVQPGEGDSGSAGVGWFPWRYLGSSFIPNPSDNNVFAIDQSWLAKLVSALKKGARENWFWPVKFLHYVPYRQLPWEIIEEMTLRHPGYIAAVVPYEGIGHHKATLFFGVPCQNYYYRAVNDMEAAASYSQQDMYADLINGMPHGYSLQEKVRAARMKPFRQYFYIDSEHHLIDNGLITTARDTFNAVEVEYVQDATKVYPNASPISRPDPSSFYTVGALKMKANDRIPEEYCRWFHSRERNCESDWAGKYTLGYLFRHLKDLYTGEILITGEPKMKPYDVVFLYDSYNDVCGPVEVEQVTHIFSQETGFVTSIIPDLCVQTNEYASATLVEAVQMYMGALWLGINSTKAKFGSGDPDALDLADLPWTGIPGNETVKISSSVSEYLLSLAGAGAPIYALYSGGIAGIPLSILLAFGGLTLFNWARQLNPIRVTPVIWKGRPFLCGLDGFTLDTAWGHAGNGLRRAFRGLEEFLSQTVTTAKELTGGGGP